MTVAWASRPQRPPASTTSVPTALAELVEISRRIGARDDLALHGGGNTSRKDAGALWVKASGRDLRDIAHGGFATVDLAAARRILAAADLTDADASLRLRAATLVAGAPAPSVETLSHAVLPHRFVLHAHPDALLAATSVPGAARRARRLLPPGFALLPWLRCGVALARGVRERWLRHGPGLRGIVLLHHGVITFADEAETAWGALLEANAVAEAALPALRLVAPPREPRWSATDVEALRAALARLARRPLALELDDGELARAFAARGDVERLARRGPLTPCNLRHTRRAPALVAHPRQLHGALARHAREERRFFRRFAAGTSLTMRDPAPRVVIAPGAGVFSAGDTAAGAAATAEVWRHTMEAMLRAEALGGYRSVSSREIFATEYG